MDITTLRVAITVIAFACFLAIVVWAWSGRRKSRFAEAALLPFDDGELDPQRLPREVPR
jgi:cytochrome c oxidase cbb3-type subunit 4